MPSFRFKWNCQSSIYLPKEKKAMARKIHKACRTHWLSLHQSVISVHRNFEALLPTFQFLEKVLLALGLYKKAKMAKFIRAIYVFTRVLPILTELRKTFQSSALNLGRVKTALDYTQTQSEHFFLF